jgi:dienelactone hydrolase
VADRLGREFKSYPVRTEHISHTVYLGPRRGPGVLLLHEIAGLTTGTLDLAEQITGAGFTVAVPHLFGRIAGEGPQAMAVGFRELLGSCIRREMNLLVFNQPERGTRWLIEAVRWLASETDSRRGVGVIGMCATGSYALGAIFDSRVGAVVASQAATPYLRPASWGVRHGDHRLREGDTALMALRFQRDFKAAKRRVKRLARILGVRVDSRRLGPDDSKLPKCDRGVEIQTGGRLHVIWADGSGHSVLSEERVELAVAQMISFLEANLGSDPIRSAERDG